MPYKTSLHTGPVHLNIKGGGSVGTISHGGRHVLGIELTGVGTVGTETTVVVTRPESRGDNCAHARGYFYTSRAHNQEHWCHLVRQRQNAQFWREFQCRSNLVPIASWLSTACRQRHANCNASSERCQDLDPRISWSHRHQWSGYCAETNAGCPLPLPGRHAELVVSGFDTAQAFVMPYKTSLHTGPVHLNIKGGGSVGTISHGGRHVLGIELTGVGTVGTETTVVVTRPESRGDNCAHARGYFYTSRAHNQERWCHFVQQARNTQFWREFQCRSNLGQIASWLSTACRQRQANCHASSERCQDLDPRISLSHRHQWPGYCAETNAGCPLQLPGRYAELVVATADIPQSLEIA